MKNLIFANGGMYFTLGKKFFKLTPIITGSFIVEEVVGGILVSNDRSSKIKKTLKNL